jgi:large subunit ribosomal protein L31
MKSAIHPTYYQTKVTCGCGNSFVVGSTAKELHIEVCNKCHPFYTGKRTLVDTAGRVEKFRQKMEHKQALQALISKSKKAKTTESKQNKEKMTLQDLAEQK